MNASLSALGVLLACVAAFAGWWMFCLHYIDLPTFGMRKGQHGPTSVTRGKNGRVMLAGAGVPAPPGIRFDIKAETALDRLAKRMGISVEGQMRDDAFDRAFYLMCDDPATIATMQRDPALRTALLDLVGGQVPAGFRFASLNCANGLLYAQYRNTRWFRGVDPDKLAGGLQLRLQRIAQRLPAKAGDLAMADRRRRDAYLVTTASFGALFVGALGAMWIHHAGLPQVIDRTALWVVAAALATIAVAAGWRWIFRRLGRSSRTHLALLQLLVAGAPGVLLCAMILVRQLDIGLDMRMAVSRSALASGLKAHTYRRLPDRYSLEVRTLDFDAGLQRPGYTVRLRLDRQQLRGANSGFVRLVEHRGALGLRWVERLEPDVVMQRRLEQSMREAE